MMFSVVTVDADSTHEAVETMRALGYVNTGELRVRLIGLSAELIMEKMGVSPALVRFKRSGRFLHNAFYWTKDQEREIAYRSAAYVAELVDQWMRDDAANA